MRHRDDRDRQRGPGREPGVEVLGLRRAGGIVDRVMPSRQSSRARMATCSDHRSGSPYADIERACASLHARSSSSPDGSPTKRAPDLAAGGIGRGPPDAERVERTRADDALVQRVVRDDDRSVDARARRDRSASASSRCGSRPSRRAGSSSRRAHARPRRGRRRRARPDRGSPTRRPRPAAAPTPTGGCARR